VGANFIYKINKIKNSFLIAHCEFEFFFSRKKMYVQLVGKLEKGSKTAIIPVVGNFLPTHTSCLLELQNLFICARPEHDAHFPLREVVQYPQGEYQPTIAVRVRLPRRLTRRRSTIYFHPHLDPVVALIGDNNENDYVVVRQKRSLPEATDEFRIKRAAPSTVIPTVLPENELFYVGYFENPTLLSRVLDVSQKTLPNLVNRIAGYHSKKSFGHFQGLLLAPLTAQIIPAGPNTEKMQITLPPNFRFGFSDIRFWLAAGFPPNQLEVYAFKTIRYYVLVNRHASTTNTFTSEIPLIIGKTLEELLGATLDSYNTTQAIPLTVERTFGKRFPVFLLQQLRYSETSASMTVPKNLLTNTFCEPNSRNGSYIMNVLVNRIANDLSIDAVKLRCSETAESKIKLSELTSLGETQERVNFKIHITGGGLIRQLFGMLTESFTWSSGEDDWLSDVLPLKVLTEAQATKCDENSGHIAAFIRDAESRITETLSEPSPEEQKRIDLLLLEQRKEAEEAAVLRRRLVAEGADRKKQLFEEGEKVRVAAIPGKDIDTPGGAAEESAEAKAAAEAAATSVAIGKVPGGAAEEIIGGAAGGATETATKKEISKAAAGTGGEATGGVAEEEHSEATAGTSGGAAGNVTEEEAGGAVGGAGIKRPRPEEETEKETEEEKAKPSKIGREEETREPTQKLPILPVAPPRQIPALEIVPEELEPEEEVDVEPEQDFEEEPEEEEEEEILFPPPIEGPPQIEEDYEEPPAQEYVEIQIPNPEPPPTSQDINILKGPLGRCTLPENFPEYCTILLHEGDARDYCVDRGSCCILGVLGHHNTPKLQANVARLGCPWIVRNLTLEFVDDHLNSYVNNARDVYVKIDLKIVAEKI
jgi:hypothetical protein